MTRYALIAGAVLWAASVSAAPRPGARAGRPVGPGAGAQAGCPNMPGGCGMQMPGMPGMGPMAAAADPVGMLLIHRQMLNLTEDQVNRLSALRVDNQKQVIRRRADLQVAHIDLMQALQQANPDRRKVEDAVRDIGRQVSELMLTQARAYLDALQVLTPDQRQMIQRMMAMHGPGMAGMPGGMGGMMGGMGAPGTPPAAPAPGGPPAPPAAPANSH